MKITLKFVGAFLIFCLPMMICGTYVYSYFLPREYFSKVVMELSPDENNGVPGVSDSRHGGSFIQTQVQVIQKKEILYPVIDELRLADKWAENNQKLPKEQIYIRLLSMMEVKQARETNLVEVGVFSTDPQMAANIANTIAIQYRKRMIDDHQQVFGMHIAQLQDQLETQRKKIGRDATEAGAEQKMLNSITDRLNSEKIQAKLDFQPVKIWEKAEPSVLPVRPNVGAIMAAGTGTGVLFALIGGALILVSSYLKEPRSFAAREPVPLV